MNHGIRLVNALVVISQKRPIDEVKKATVGVIAVLGNLKSVGLEQKRFFLN
jgi:hypothetical protein